MSRTNIILRTENEFLKSELLKVTEELKRTQTKLNKLKDLLLENAAFFKDTTTSQNILEKAVELFLVGEDTTRSILEGVEERRKREIPKDYTRNRLEMHLKK